MKPTTPAEVRELLSRRAVELVDVREPGEFADGHIEGSLLLPLAALEDQAARLDRSKTVCLVCLRGPRAEQGAARLERLGFETLVLSGGLQAWRAAGYPVRRLSGVWPIERQVRLVAGTLVVAGAALGWLFEPRFYGLSAFVGAGLVFSALTNTCGMAAALRLLPWNRGACRR